MNTATILIIAILAFVAHADPDFCQLCQDSFDDVRAEVGNDGKNASTEDLLAAFENAGNKRWSNPVYRNKWNEMNKKITEYIEIVKKSIDRGSDNLIMCEVYGDCKWDCLPRCLQYSAGIRAKVGNDGKNATIGAIATASEQFCKKIFPELEEECTKNNLDVPKLKDWYDSGKTDEIVCEELCKD